MPAKRDVRATPAAATGPPTAHRRDVDPVPTVIMPGMPPEAVLRLQRTAGNQATVGAIAVQRNDLAEAVAAGREVIRQSYEYSISLRMGKLVKGSGKLKMKVKLRTDPDEAVKGGTKVGFGGLKVGQERAFKRSDGRIVKDKVQSQVAAALLKMEATSGPLFGFPGLQATFETKALELKVADIRKPADVDLLKVGFGIRGRVPAYEVLGAAPYIFEITVQGSGEIALPAKVLMELKVAAKAKEQMLKAADEVEDLAKKIDQDQKALARLEKEAADLDKQVAELEKELADMEAEERKLEKERSRGNKDRKKQSRAGRARLKARRKQINRRLQGLRKQMGDGAKKASELASRLDGTKRAIAAAGERLQSAGRMLQRAAKKADGLSKKAIEKISDKLMKRLATKLGGKLIAKLIPGLNVISTIADIIEAGGALKRLITGEAEFGPGGGDSPKKSKEAGAGEGGAGEGGGGDGGSQEATEASDHAGGGSPDAGTKKGPGGAGGEATAGGQGEADVALSAPARSVLEALRAAGAPAMSADELALLDQAIPADLSPGRVQQLIEQLKSVQAEDGVDVLVRIQELLREEQLALAEVEPPRTLLPGPAQGLQPYMRWDADAGKVFMPPDELAALQDITFTLADGLKTKIENITTESEEVADGLFGVKVTVTSRVIDLPDHAGPGYPWKDNEKHPDTVHLLFRPATGDWLSTDSSAADALRSVLVLENQRYSSKEGAVIEVWPATLKIGPITRQATTKIAGGFAVDLMLRATPQAIKEGVQEAGYLSVAGWVSFVVDQPVDIPLRFVHRVKQRQPVPAGR